ncbi:hypothetical protein DNU06_17545 [Putridiphycobacter roseus]|uniref:Secretion system C-terminal sorting domain-containing protein n=2 Tax=Putridiphycobacter roseus TaxID=2219161 RepID=A0A2W1MVZ1_9FLAO|nr:hypothetical protein DNU06_17545 [Putridiphycobacter roseus]
MYFTANDSLHGRELWRMESCNVQTTSYQSIEACQQYTSPVGTTYYQNAYFKDTISNSCGADSILTISLQVHPLSNLVSMNSFVLTANQGQMQYQWLNCDNGNQAIVGETNQSFTPNEDGNYAVIITDTVTGCTDTSACAFVYGLGIDDENELNLSVYPNPNTGSFYIQGKDVTQLNISAYAITGQVIKVERQLTDDKIQITFPKEFKGVALLKIQSNSGQVIQKILCD